MYGGVAQTYCLWKMDGEPFKEGNAWYVRMIHPLTKAPKKVRFYTDKKHADLMPQAKVDKKFAGSVFGFKDANDQIQIIYEKDISAAEAEQHFHYNWKRGAHWLYAEVGAPAYRVWYAPKGEPVPPIKNAHKVKLVTWEAWVKACRARSKQMHDGKEEGYWFEEVSL